MKFLTDVGELAVVLELDSELPGVDLTRDGLGDRCLDAAVEGMLSGTLLDPHRWRTAPRDIEPRVAIWYYPSTGWKGDGCAGHARAFHAGHPLTGSPARPILGWTPAARETCRRLVAEADLDRRP
jgi:hypothetical protein